MIKVSDLVARAVSNGTATVHTLDDPAVPATLRLRQVYGLIAALLAAGHNLDSDTVVWVEAIDGDEIVVTTGPTRIVVTPSGHTDQLCIAPDCDAEPEIGIAVCRRHLDVTHPGMEPEQGPGALREWYLNTWHERAASELLRAEAAASDVEEFTTA